MNYPSRTLIISMASLLAVSTMASYANAQQKAVEPGTLSNVLYGAAYYNEYMPYERLDKDIAMMKDAGFTVARMGESTWSLWEPEDGRFEYAWMDRVVDAMGKAGIKVIMGTPTYSFPRGWIMPILRFSLGHLAERLIFYGMRQNMDTAILPIAFMRKGSFAT